MPSDVPALETLEAAGIEPSTRSEVWTALASDVLQGLAAMPKTLPARWFYDARGSELFEQITELDEYYLTRREEALLDRVAADLARESAATEVVELGSGSSTKTVLVLDALQAAGQLERYVPLDVSASAVDGAVERLSSRYPDVAIEGRVADFTRPLGDLGPASGPRLFLLLGSTIGNFQPVEARALLQGLAPSLGPQDRLLLGTDLVKDPKTIEAAYNDSEGVTAAFTLNLLDVLNHELQAEFDRSRFRHEAFFNPALERIETRIRSTEAQVVALRALGIEVAFLEDEGILVEISRKFTRESVERTLTEGGFALRSWHEDGDGAYALSLGGLA